jgi:hypothetical protein
MAQRVERGNRSETKQRYFLKSRSSSCSFVISSTFSVRSDPACSWITEIGERPELMALAGFGWLGLTWAG